MWYAVETVFIDGALFGSRCLFDDGDDSPRGHCYAGLNEEPGNRCEKIFGDRIEVHTDWFESENLAKAFCDGKITYVHHYIAFYKAANRSAMRRFAKREMVKVDVQNGIYPHRGMDKFHESELSFYEYCKSNVDLMEYQIIRGEIRC